VRTGEELLPAECFFEEVVDFECSWGCWYLLAKRYMYERRPEKMLGVDDGGLLIDC
jgi:hypothetical protein